MRQTTDLDEIHGPPNDFRRSVFLANKQILVQHLMPCVQTNKNLQMFLETRDFLETSTRTGTFYKLTPGWNLQ